MLCVTAFLNYYVLKEWAVGIPHAWERSTIVNIGHCQKIFEKESRNRINQNMKTGLKRRRHMGGTWLLMLDVSVLTRAISFPSKKVKTIESRFHFQVMNLWVEILKSCEVWPFQWKKLRAIDATEQYYLVVLFILYSSKWIHCNVLYPCRQICSLDRNFAETVHCKMKRGASIL